jgi:hypothetical protein
MHQQEVGRFAMAKTCSTVLATLVFGSISMIQVSRAEAGSVCDAADASNIPSVLGLPDRIANGGPASAALCKEAPIGHRQPRAVDIPASQVPPIEIEMRREDEMITKKLIICRHC